MVRNGTYTWTTAKQAVKKKKASNLSLGSQATLGVGHVKIQQCLSFLKCKREKCIRLSLCPVREASPGQLIPVPLSSHPGVGELPQEANVELQPCTLRSQQAQFLSQAHFTGGRKSKLEKMLPAAPPLLDITNKIFRQFLPVSQINIKHRSLPIRISYHIKNLL